MDCANDGRGPQPGDCCPGRDAEVPLDGGRSGIGDRRGTKDTELLRRAQGLYGRPKTVEKREAVTALCG